jgi:DNA-binding response OmpR family regulator
VHVRPGDPDILAHCAALVLARDERNLAALMTLAHKLRFGVVLAHGTGLGQERFDHRLVFYLVHFDFDTDAKLELLHALRHAGSVSLSFAPVVVFLRDGTDQDIQAHVEMGFDDVINVPEEGRVIAARLAAQIGQEHLYIETRNYLGPDRHRLDRPGVTKRKAMEEHAQLTVLRTPEAGVHIVRREVVARGR